MSFRDAARLPRRPAIATIDCRAASALSRQIARSEPGTTPGDLPSHPLSQRGDVGHVMRAVPGIERDDPVDAAQTVLRMTKRTRKIGIAHRTQYVIPALMDTLEQPEGGLDGGERHISKVCPCLLVIRLDGRLIFSERKFGADESVHVTVGQVMHNLPHGPSAGPIRRIELLGRESAHSFTQLGWSVLNRIQSCLALG